MNIKRVRRLMRLMGLMPIYRRRGPAFPPRGTSLPVSAAGRPHRPAQQVWCADITYIPTGEGLPLSGGDHGLVEPQGPGLAPATRWMCSSASTRLMRRSSYGPPEIFNTDGQPVHLVGLDATQGGRGAHLDGRARRFLDNIFIERLWRSLKYECIYLHAFSGGREARQGIGDWMTFYNHRRPHADGGETPVGVRRERLSASGPGLRPDLHPTAKAANEGIMKLDRQARTVA